MVAGNDMLILPDSVARDISSSNLKEVNEAKDVAQICVNI